MDTCMLPEDLCIPGSSDGTLNGFDGSQAIIGGTFVFVNSRDRELYGDGVIDNDCASAGGRTTDHSGDGGSGAAHATNPRQELAVDTEIMSLALRLERGRWQNKARIPTSRIAQCG